MKKVLVSLGLAVSLLVSWTATEVVAADVPIILLDGLPLPFPVPPVIVEDRTMVPFRAIAEALGVSVTWLPETRSIDARGHGTEVLLTIDQRSMRVNGQWESLEVPPLLVSDRTLVPLRFFSEVFGAKVGWEQTTRTVTVASPVRVMRTLAFYAIRSFTERHLIGRFSDIAFGWSVLTPDGRLDTTSDPDYHWPEAAPEITPEGLMIQAAIAGARRHLMVHALDSHGDFTRLVQDSALSARAVKEMARVVAEQGFQGVVLDMEYLGQTEQGPELERVRQGFTDFVRGLGVEMRKLGRETIVSVHPPNGAFHGYDYTALAAEVDFLQLMAHDYRDRSTEAGPEPPDKVMEAIEATLKGVPREKVLLGVVAPYETPETLGQKAGLAKRYGLAGLTIWRLGTVGSDRMEALELSVQPQK